MASCCPTTGIGSGWSRRIEESGRPERSARHRGPAARESRLRVFANRNDFLTSGEDVDWLTELVGRERVAFFPTGGHLGNLHQPEVQRAIMDSLADLLPSSDSAAAR